jgi:hypothetical protein
MFLFKSKNFLAGNYSSLCRKFDQYLEFLLDSLKLILNLPEFVMRMEPLLLALSAVELLAAAPFAIRH